MNGKDKTATPAMAARRVSQHQLPQQQQAPISVGAMSPEELVAMLRQVMAGDLE